MLYEDAEEINFSFELRTSDDGKTLILTCTADAPMDTNDYVQALDAFMQQLMSEDKTGESGKHNLQ